jgi:putative flippase GtrA
VAKRKDSTIKQAGKFGLVGILNTVIDYTIFIALTKIFSIPLDRVWTAKLVSGTVAMINSFYFNKTWVFKAKDTKELPGQAARFLVSTIVAVYVIQTGLVQFFSSSFPQIGQWAFSVADSLGIVHVAPGILTEAFVIKTVAFGLATIGSLVWNFTLYKFWAFKE